MSEHDSRKAHAPEQGDMILASTGDFGNDQALALGGLITDIMRPMVAALGKMLQNNSEALERLASAQAVQNNRLEALEKQIRLNTPITSKQASYLNDAIRNKAREMLDKRGLADDRWAITKMGNAIRRDVLSRYGVATVKEIPKHEYSVAMSQISMWNNGIVFRDIVKEARERADKMAMGKTEQSPCVDDSPAYPPCADQSNNESVRAAGETGGVQT